MGLPLPPPAKAVETGGDGTDTDKRAKNNVRRASSDLNGDGGARVLSAVSSGDVRKAMGLAARETAMKALEVMAQLDSLVWSITRIRCGSVRTVMEKLAMVLIFLVPATLHRCRTFLANRGLTDGEIGAPKMEGEGGSWRRLPMPSHIASRGIPVKKRDEILQDMVQLHN